MNDQEYQQIISEMDYYQKLLGEIERRISNLRQTRLDLEEFEKEDSKKFLAAITTGIYVESELKNKELFVNIGSGTVVKKSVKEVVDIISKKEKDFLEDQNKVSMRLNEYYKLMQHKGE